MPGFVSGVGGVLTESARLTWRTTMLYRGSATRGVAPGAPRALALLMLLVGVAIAVASARHARAYSGAHIRQAGASVTVVLVLLLVCGAGLLLAGLWSVLRNARRRRGDGDPQHLIERHDTPWQRAAALLLVALALGLAGAAIYAARFIPTTTGANQQHPTVTTTRTVPQASTSAASPSRGRGTRSDTDRVVVIMAATVAVAVVGYAGYRALRRHDAATTTTSTDDGERQHERIRDVVADAAAGLSTEDDPRAAILASYRAMEDSLARAGAGRRDADTAEELLTRAAHSGLTLPSSARRLAGLFHEARFSTHPMTAAQRSAAAAALAEIRDALTGAS